MKKSTIFGLVLIPVSIFFAYLLYDSIWSEIERQRQIQASEALVIERLKLIREVQDAYEDKYNRYAPNWDSLHTFLLNDTIFETQEREIVVSYEEALERGWRTREDYLLGDSVRVEIDTLGFGMAKELLLAKHPDVEPQRIEYIPGKEDKKFKLETDRIEKGGVMVNVIKVSDPYPADTQRKEDAKSRKRQLLHFGSLEEVTTSGNWE